jgi:ABC-type branched-subunit amino acid transport system ATPase component/ABC-type branched-subunit amino acid transport system permease subunit
MLYYSSTKRPLFGLLALLLVGAIIILATGNTYTLLILTLVSIWAVLGLSWNLLGGYAGLFSFGHAAFFGLGSYTVGILFHDYGVTPSIGWPLAALVGAVAGIFVGYITFRLKGPYFTLAMLAYPLALLSVFEWAGWNELELPMKREGGWAYMQFEDGRIIALIALALMGLAIWISIRIERSRFGLALVAIRQNELAASAAGLRVLSWKLWAIAVSGAMAASAGGLYAVVLLIITPQAVFGLPVSAQALIVTMFGGLGTVWGPVLGSIILVPLSEFLYANLAAALPGIQGVVFGLAIMAVILIQPQGIFWAIYDRFAFKSTDEGPAFQDVMLPERGPSNSSLGSPLLEISNVSLNFSGLRALAKVSITVNESEIVGIIGPNGAGKTTLFNAINGFIKVNEGDIKCAGSSLLGFKPEQVAAMGIGRTFQTARAFPRLTLLENVVVGAFVRYSDDKRAIAVAQNALTRLGLADRAYVSAGSLTNRELRLMELARALACEPRLILMDESFAGLANEDIEGMLPVIRRLRSEGITIVIIEHTMHAMIRLVDRLIVLDQGAVIANGSPNEVVKDSRVITAYLGKRWAEHAQA